MIRTDAVSPWLRRQATVRTTESVVIRLFCFPYAGGAANVFRAWAALAGARVDLVAIQLPGHGDRLMEPPIARLSALVPQLADEIRPHTDLPFAFFGHSLGALAAFELTRELRRTATALPVHLFVSGRRAPHLIPSKRPLHALPEAAFRSELRQLQGTPPAVLDDEELMALVSPVLRADFGLCETYNYVDEAALDIPLTAFGGKDDAEATADELDAWSLHSTKFRGVYVFDGGHFFLNDHAARMVDRIRTDITAASSLPT